jgi:hypothetical protein
MNKFKKGMSMVGCDLGSLIEGSPKAAATATAGNFPTVAIPGGKAILTGEIHNGEEFAFLVVGQTRISYSPRFRGPLGAFGPQDVQEERGKDRYFLLRREDADRLAELCQKDAEDGAEAKLVHFSDMADTALRDLIDDPENN